MAGTFFQKVRANEQPHRPTLSEEEAASSSSVSLKLKA
jgi:hypothetical protein